MTYTIKLNATGTHNLEITEENLQTIQKYALFSELVDSTGFINEEVLDKLKFNVRSLITNNESDTKDLLDLCLDVIYHPKMKAFGLKELLAVYTEWAATSTTEEAPATEEI